MLEPFPAILASNLKLCVHGDPGQPIPGDPALRRLLVTIMSSQLFFRVLRLRYTVPWSTLSSKSTNRVMLSVTRVNVCDYHNRCAQLTRISACNSLHLLFHGVNVRGNSMNSSPFLPCALPPGPACLCPSYSFRFWLASADTATPSTQCCTLQKLWKIMQLGPGDAVLADGAMARPVLISASKARSLHRLKTEVWCHPKMSA